MKMFRTFVVLLIFTITVTCSKLNVPRVLLPISPKTPVNYTLEVSDGGCYTWSSSRPEAVKVTPLPSNENEVCAQKAVVTSTGASTHKTSAIILAEDQSTGEVLRCDVIVNHIHSLQIAMKTRELFIEDAPEEFSARAYDDQGNEFSSVDGLVFRWTIEGHSSDTENEPVLRWVKFADSSYEVLPSIAQLESQGLQGHIILIEGLRTGSARTSVKLDDEFFKNVPAVDVNILVVANLVIDPPEVYVLPGSSFPLRLSQIRQGRAESIPLPSSQYYLDVEDLKVGSILENSGIFQARELGTTNVRLRDRNIKDPDLSHAPFVTVHVVLPHRLALALLPHRSWATEVGVLNTIIVELFDEHNNYIQPSDDIFVKTHIPQSFVVVNSTVNGTYHDGVPATPGTYKVKASLRTIVLADGSELELKSPLKTSADLEIYQPIVVNPTSHILPWDPVTQPRHEVKLSASGGSESYQWSSTNNSLATVTQTGLVKTHGWGTCNISASMTKNLHLRGSAIFYIYPAINISIVNYIAEVEEGSMLLVPVQMKTQLPDGNITKFTDCRLAPIRMDLSDKKFFEIVTDHSEQPLMRGCRSIPVRAKGVSVTKLTLSITVNDTVVKDSIVLASYKRLRHVYPSNGETTLALGATNRLVFEGGPLPWVNKPSGHFRKANVDNETVANVGEIVPVVDNEQKQQQKDRFQFEVMCLNIGETNVVIRVGNIASSSNISPVQSQLTFKVVCSHPWKVHVVPEVRLPDNVKAPCPLDSVTQRMTAQSYLDLNLIVVVKDNSGRKLDNFTTVDLGWTLSNPSLAKLGHKDGVILETKKQDGYVVLGRSSQLLKPAGQTGPLDVTVRVLGYKAAVLKQLGLHAQPEIKPPTPVYSDPEDEEEDEDDNLAYTVDLLLVNDASVDPDTKSLFNHKDNKLLLHVLDGSGMFHVDHQPKDVAHVQYHAANRTLLVTPLVNGELKITITDQCLWARKPAVANIQVVGLSRIELQVADKIEQGSVIPMIVNMFDTQGHALDSQVLHYITLQPVLGSNIVRVKAMEDMKHTVEGVSLGETTISFNAGKVRSTIVNVQVFAPLTLSPRNVTLVLGATLQVVSSGGPQPDAVVEYSLVNGDIASCSPNGMVKGIKLGHSKLLARAVGTDRQTGKQRIYSEDEVDVHVISLSGIRITLPLTRVKQNSEIPVYVMGLDENETPFAFGTCEPNLNFQWSLSDNQSGQLFSRFRRSGLDPQPNSSHFTVQFQALQPGHTLLRVRVTSTNPKSGQLDKSVKELVDEVSIQVYESLQLTNPYSIDGDNLVMMPNTGMQLKTNLDSSATVQYTVADSDIVHIDGKGYIHSGTSLGQSSLIATAKNNYGVTQSLSTLVEVRSVSYMMFTTSPILTLHSGNRLSVIPRGFEFELRLTYHDTLGRIFHAARKQLAFRPSRLDLLRISLNLDNSTMILHADKVGQTVLQFYDEIHPGLGDYVRIDVADVISPSQSDFIVGDVVCFTTPILPLTGARSKWSSNKKLFDIDPESGVAIAIAAGTGDVFYSISSERTTSTTVSIAPVTSLKFINNIDKAISNGRRVNLNYPLTLGHVASNVRGQNCSTDAVERMVRMRPAPFTCHMTFTTGNEINIEDVFSIKAEFDSKLLTYQCVIKPTGVPTPSTSIMDTNIIIKAQYSNDIYDYITLLFHPAVYVQTPELHVSDLQPSVHLIIAGKSTVLQQTEYIPSDSSALSVYGPQHHSQQSVKVLVKFNLGYYDSATNLYVTVRNTLTGQHIEVPVKVKLFAEESKCPAHPRESTWANIATSVLHFCQEWALSFLSLLGTAAAIYIGYRALCGSGYRTTTDMSVFLQSNRSSSSGYSSPFTQRGPQLWSVDDSHLYHSGVHQRLSPTSSPLLQKRQSPSY